MKLLSDNLKKAGYFNAILIVIALVLRLVTFVSIPTLGKVDAIICIVALVYGLIYALNGYKKDASKYYKTFMYLYLLSAVITLILAFSAAIIELKNYGILVILANVVILVSIFVLACINNLGEKKSNYLALLVLALNIFKLLFNVAIKGAIMPIVSAGIANIMLACILCVFVSAKYADKKSRGAK